MKRNIRVGVTGAGLGGATLGGLLQQSFRGAEGGMKKRFELPGQAAVRRARPEGHLVAASTFGGELQHLSTCTDIRQAL